jgi:hypothetical protein
LNSGSLDLTIALALKQLEKQGFVEYDMVVIRNLIMETNNTRINDLVMQYRVGTTDAFVTLHQHCILVPLHHKPQELQNKIYKK